MQARAKLLEQQFLDAQERAEAAANAAAQQAGGSQLHTLAISVNLMLTLVFYRTSK